jgi:hypothetical protein
MLKLWVLMSAFYPQTQFNPLWLPQDSLIQCRSCFWIKSRLHLSNDSRDSPPILHVFINIFQVDKKRHAQMSSWKWNQACCKEARSWGSREAFSAVAQALWFLSFYSWRNCRKHMMLSHVGCSRNSRVPAPMPHSPNRSSCLPEAFIVCLANGKSKRIPLHKGKPLYAEPPGRQGHCH